MRRIEKITGRVDDMLIIRGVNLFPNHVEDLVVATEGLSPHYVLEVTRAGIMDELTVKVERDPINPGDSSVAVQLQKRIKGVLGVSSKVILCDPGDIERSAGKAKRVIDHRKL
ncbi:MAG: hypothetical protein JKY04_06630 [Sneathiella sp.]|nr:hypothetical protein [Sneathiella sp.]